MNCVLFKKSTMTKSLPADPDPSANPGEFGLVDNEDGTLTIVIVDQAGCPSPISPNDATMTVESDAPDVVEVVDLSGFTFRERVTKGTAPAPAVSGKSPQGKATTPAVQHPAPARHPPAGAGAVANITVTVTWVGTIAPNPHRLTWKDTITGDSTGGKLIIERGPVGVSQS